MASIGKTGSETGNHHLDESGGRDTINHLNGSSESDDSATVTYNVEKAQDEIHDYFLKMVVVGDCCTGKTCLVDRICGNRRGLETVCLDGNKLKIQVWDTAGNERYRTLTASHESKGAFVLFDVNNESSLQGCNLWLNEMEHYVSADTVKLLIGTKCDIREEHYDTDNTSYVDYFTAKKFADEHQMHYIEISSKDDTNVEFALLTMTRLIMKSNRIS